MTEAEKKARLAELLRIKEQRAQADLSSLTVRGEAKKRLDDARGEIAKLEEISKEGFSESHSRGVDQFVDSYITPVTNFAQTNANSLLGGTLATYAGAEGVKGLMEASKRVSAPSDALIAGADKLDATPKAGALQPGEVRVQVDGAQDPSKGLNASKETKDILAEFKSKLKAEGISYEKLKAHKGMSMKQRLEAEFGEQLGRKYQSFAGWTKDKIKGQGGFGKVATKTGIYGGGLPLVAMTVAETKNIVDSFNASDDAAKAQEELEVMRQKIPGLLRDYHMAQKNHVDTWLTENAEGAPNYGRYKALQGKLDMLLK
jgi:hypothetical protein